MGALVAFELCRELRALGRRLPDRLFLSGRRAPHLPFRGIAASEKSDEELLADIRRLNGTPPELLSDPVASRLVLRVLRADLECVQTYRCRPERPLPVPITCFGGDADEWNSPDEIELWREHTSSSFETEVLPGGHFYQETPSRLLRALISRMQPVTALGI